MFRHQLFVDARGRFGRVANDGAAHRIRHARDEHRLRALFMLEAVERDATLQPIGHTRFHASRTQTALDVLDRPAAPLHNMIAGAVDLPITLREPCIGFLLTLFGGQQDALQLRRENRHLRPAGVMPRLVLGADEVLPVGANPGFTLRPLRPLEVEDAAAPELDRIQRDVHGQLNVWRRRRAHGDQIGVAAKARIALLVRVVLNFRKRVDGDAGVVPILNTRRQPVHPTQRGAVLVARRTLDAAQNHPVLKLGDPRPITHHIRERQVMVRPRIAKATLVEAIARCYLFGPRTKKAQHHLQVMDNGTRVWNPALLRLGTRDPRPVHARPVGELRCGAGLELDAILDIPQSFPQGRFGLLGVLLSRVPLFLVQLRAKLKRVHKGARCLWIFSRAHAWQSPRCCCWFTVSRDGSPWVVT